jgi:hypothetical protein
MRFSCHDSSPSESATRARRMQITHSLRERFLLEYWLRQEPSQTDARSLVANTQTLEPAVVADRLEKLRALQRVLRTERSMLDVRPPLGRGHVTRRPGGVIVRWLSPWEEAWLRVDRLKGAGLLANPALGTRDLPEAFRTSLLNAIGIAILCLDTAAEGETLARTVALDASVPLPDRAWLAWLAGGAAIDRASSLSESVQGETPGKALAAAVEGRWADAESLLPKGFQKPFPKTIKASGTRMHGQLLAQLASHVLRGTPSREVIDASLGVLFGFFGFDTKSDWWDGREVMGRLPLLALYARTFEPRGTGAAVLHRQRAQNAHLVAPPPRTFVTPGEVLGAIERLEGILVAAVREGRGLRVELSEEGNVYWLV